MSTGLPRALAKIVLGSDSRQRLRILQTLLALGMYAVFAGLQQIGVESGWLTLTLAMRLDLFNLSGALLFYALIRSGINLRLRFLHPSLTLAQMTWALASIALAYANTGPGQGASLILLVLVVLFGLFSLTRQVAIGFTTVSLLVMAGVMASAAWSQPGRYPPSLELLHWCAVAVVLAAVTLVSVRLSSMRVSLVRQRTELASALERLRILATHDELTGLVNRRAVIDRMDGEFAALDKMAPVLTLAMVDIDHFKRVNDTHGHTAGDLVLKRFAGHGLAELRSGESFARWGGEEFLLMIPGPSEAGASRFLERLRERLTADRFSELSGGLSLTFSAGLATCDRLVDLEETIARADRAMYEAKRLGRDRVVRFSPPDVTAELPLELAHLRSDRRTCQAPTPTSVARPYQVSA